MIGINASLIYAGNTLARMGVVTKKDIAVALSAISTGPSTTSNLDYSGATRLAEIHSWDIFSNIGDECSAFREVLANIALRTRPAWLALLPYGRQKVIERLTINELQCFQIAQLCDSTVIEVVDWWDRLAIDVRADVNLRLLESGRSGEQRSMKLETELLRPHGLSAMWIALDDNTAGFDIQSWRPGDSGWTHPITRYIEVKTSAVPRQFFLSRNEWEFAMRHSTDWELQLWYGSNTRPFQYSATDILRHIPDDVGRGRWRELVIDMSEEDPL